MKPAKPKPPVPIKPIRRWCIATQMGVLIEGAGGLLTFREPPEPGVVRTRVGERLALIEMREVTKGVSNGMVG